MFAFGKVAVEAQAERDAMGTPVAVVRCEQIYPWPYAGVAEIIAKDSTATEIVWLQEEPQNMGAWNHIKGHLFSRYDDSHEVRLVSRQESASPATGVLAVHQAELHDLMKSALGGF